MVRWLRFGFRNRAVDDVCPPTLLLICFDRFSSCRTNYIGHNAEFNFLSFDVLNMYLSISTDKVIIPVMRNIVRVYRQIIKILSKLIQGIYDNGIIMEYTIISLVEYMH